MGKIGRMLLVITFLLQAIGGNSVVIAAGNPSSSVNHQTEMAGVNFAQGQVSGTNSDLSPTDTPTASQTSVSVKESATETIAEPSKPVSTVESPTLETVTPTDSATPGKETITPLPSEETVTPTVTEETTTPTATEETITPTATEETSTVDVSNTSTASNSSVSDIVSTGGMMTGLNGKLTVNIPDGALKEDAQFSIHDPSAEDQPDRMLGNFPFEIDALGKTSRSEINKFDKEITLALDYTDLYTGPDPHSLAFYYYDQTQKDWLPLPSWVDTDKHILYGLTNHLTLFDYNVDQWQAAELPNLDAAQTSLFTGAASYSIPIDVPAGPGGLQPSLSLDYNSQEVDNATVLTQAGWAGMGWSIETGYIERNIGWNSDSTDDDTFNLVLNGKSSQLLKATDGTWYTADEDFTKITYDSTNNKWTIYDKTGTVYVFGEKDGDIAHYPIFDYFSGGTCNFKASIPWRWELSRVTNIYGQSLTYIYVKGTKDFRLSCDNNLPHNVDIAIYPESIVYPNSHYRIYFVIDNIRLDYAVAWSYVGSRVFFERSRLNEIQIQQDTDGNWSTTNDQTLIRKYVLTYADTNDAHIDPGNTWTEGDETLTLDSVQEFGDDGTTSLPATTFTYGDNMHLTKVENGYGASVEFAYEQWYETDAGDSAKWEVLNRCWAQSQNGWQSIGSGSIWCDPNGTRLYFTGEIIHEVSIGMSQPGVMYLITAETNNTYSATAGIEYLTGSNAHDLTYPMGQSVENPSTYMALPPDSSSLSRALVICPPSHTCDIGYFSIKRLVNRYRVTSKSVFDGINASPQVTTYRYDDAATNDAQHSAAASGTPVANLFYEPLSEYRGNASVAETGPDGKVTTTYFYQDDARRGQASDTFVSSQSFYDTFDSIDTSQWSYTPSTLADHSITRLGGDNALKVTNSAADWSARAIHQGSSLQDGNMVMVDFQITGTTTKTVLALESGGSCCSSTYRRLGIVVDRDSNGNPYVYSQYYDGSSFHTGSTLISAGDYKVDTWYVLMLIIDGSNSSIHVWQRDNPDIRGSYSQAMDSGKSWLFSHWVWSGTAYLDEYSEGNLYTWDHTTYSVCNPSAGSSSDSECPAAITLAAIPMPIGSAVGLAVYWVRKIETQSLNYEGRGSFTGTQVDYKYAPSSQGNTQYGNQTNTLEYYWNGSSFILYRGTWQRYYPNTTGIYLVGLIGFINTNTCTTTCDWSAATLTSSTWYLYDNHTSFSAIPTVGVLTGKRVMTRWAGPGTTNNMYSDEIYAYDGWGNRVKVTKYTGEGTGGTLASSGAETTVTCYGAAISGETCSDDGYHTYPLWTRDSLGHVTTDTYDYIQGLPTQETDPNGAVTDVSYDAFGRVIDATRPGDTSSTIHISYSNVSPYFWTEATQKIDSSNSKNVYKFYNGLGELVQTQTGDVLTGSNNQDIVVDYTYDGYSRVLTQSVPYIVTNSAGYHTPDTSQARTQAEYDILGRTVAVIATDGTVQMTQYLIDSSNYGYETRQFDANGNETDTYSDVWGRTTRSVPSSGSWLTYSYNTQNQLIQTQKMNGEDGSVYTTTTFTYDMADRKTGMADPDMGAWTYTYDAMNNLTGQTDALSCTTSLTYDVLNRVTGKSFGTNCNTGNNRAVTYTYDQTSSVSAGIGHRTSMTDYSGTTTWTYDLRGRVTSQTNHVYDGSTDLGSYTKLYSYNSDDSLKQEVLPNNETVNYTYNSQGLQTGITGYITTIQYDPTGRTTAMNFANNLSITWNYNAWTLQGGRLQNKTAGLNNTTVQDLSYAYDEVGNITEIQDEAVNQEYDYTYDNLNRLTGAEGRLINNPTATPTITQTPTTTNTSTITQTPTTTDTPTITPTLTVTPTPTEVSTITIGETNIVGTDTSDYGGIVLAEETGLEQDATILSLSFYVASASGNLRLGIYEGDNVTSRYLVAETDEFTPVDGWNTQNVMTSVLLPAGDYWLAILPESNNLHFIDTSGGTCNWFDNTFGEFPGSFYAEPMGGDCDLSLYATLEVDFLTPTVTATVTRTPTNTATKTKTPTNTATRTNTATVTQTATITSTPTRTQAATNTPFYTETVVYDANNGRIASRNGDMAYSYGSTSHPNAVTGVTESASDYSSYTYDADGNMVTRSITADSVTTNYTLSYDAEGHMIADSGGTVSDRYVYNGDGTLILQVENGVKTIKLGDFEEVLSNGATPPMQNPSTIPGISIYGNNSFTTTRNTTIYNNVTWKTYYGGMVERIQGGSSLGEMDGVYYLMQDHLGSITDVVALDGSVSRTRYAVWGETLSTDGTRPTDKQYTGQEKSSNSGLYFYQARWYDQSLGRFIQPDTIIPNQYDSQSWDKYAYVDDNPINRNDPTGHCPWCVLLAGGLIGAVVGAAAVAITNAINHQNTTWAEVGAGAVAGALIGSGAVLFAPAVVAGAGDLLLGAGVATSSTALFGAGMTAYGTSTVLESAIVGGSSVVNSTNAIASGSTANNSPNFIVTENGETIIVPDGATGPAPAKNGAGFQFTGGNGGNGLNQSVANVRIMDPTLPNPPSPGYPGGYVSYSNVGGQTVNPYSGQTVSHSSFWWHMPLRPN